MGLFRSMPRDVTLVQGQRSVLHSDLKPYEIREAPLGKLHAPPNGTALLRKHLGETRDQRSEPVDQIVIAGLVGELELWHHRAILGQVIGLRCLEVVVPVPSILEKSCCSVNFAPKLRLSLFVNECVTSTNA